MTDYAQVTISISPEERAVRNGHTGRIVWLTGLSGAGKSTIAMAMERRLFDEGNQVYVLDGDIVRTGLCEDLGFSSADRTENIRRIGEVARIMANAGLLVVVAFISPFRADRDRPRPTATGCARACRRGDSPRCTSAPRWRSANSATPRASTPRPARVS